MSYKELADPKQAADGSWYVQFEVKNAEGQVVSKTTLTGKSEREVWKKLQMAYAESSEAIVRLRNRKSAEKPADLSTPEEEALNHRKATERLKRESAAVQFEKRHLYTGDYYACEANATMIFNYLDAKGLDFTADNLEIAFDELTKQNRLVSPQVQIEKMPEPEPPPAPMDVPWSPNPLTKKGIKDLGRSYSEFYNNKNEALRNEFRRQVDAALRGE
ncbi:MAG TPA: hypothetical protein VOA88_01085 [Candidatus Dormibacteraeota bacterium]|nr:hypothetical protein [Candidatus Dormibacteraeota bacterium]